MKKIFYYGKQIIIFIACTVVFTSTVLSSLTKRSAPSPGSFLSENAVEINILPVSNDGENITYGQLYSLFEAEEELTVIKPYKGKYLTGIQIFSNNDDFSIEPYVKSGESSMFNAAECLLFLEEEYRDFGVADENDSSLFLLNGKQHGTKGFFSTDTIYDYSFVSNLYSFKDNKNAVNNESFYVDCGSRTAAFVSEINRLFTENTSRYEVRSRVNAPEGSAAVEIEDIIIYISVVLMIIIVCFGSAVYIRIMIGKRSKEIFCKFLCGAELSVIQKEFLCEFAGIAAAGSIIGAAAAFVLKLLQSIINPVCVAISAVIVPVLIFCICVSVQKRSFPKENELQGRTRE